MAVYAVSDLHGHYDVFIRGLEKIGFGDSDRLYLIGDAIDRGPDGIRILQHIRAHDNMDLLIGNHEFMMLNSVDLNGEAKCNGTDSELWLYYNGGNETFSGYKKLDKKERQELLFWLCRRSLIKTVKVGGRTFCLTHSFYIPEYTEKTYGETEYGVVWDIVWKSMFREDETYCSDIYADYPDLFFITGHVPVQRVRRMIPTQEDPDKLEPYSFRNFMDIDGGCAVGYLPYLDNGALFVRLDDLKVFPSQFESVF